MSSFIYMEADDAEEAWSACSRLAEAVLQWKARCASFEAAAEAAAYRENRGGDSEVDQTGEEVMSYEQLHIDWRE